MQKDWLKYFLFSSFSGILMALSWPSIGDLSFLLFVGFIPLFLLEHQLFLKAKSSLSVFFWSLMGFLLFNTASTWWIYNASDWGAFVAVICNSLFMATVFFAFAMVKRKVGQKEAYITFPILWLAFEYLHLNWELSWSWLSLGNGFANSVSWIQWYEYTGILGGSLWVLVLNVMGAKLLIGLTQMQRPKKLKYVSYLTTLIAPVLISSTILLEAPTASEKIKVAIVQPNIDPYKEKFGGMVGSDQIDHMVDLAREVVDEETELLLFPETAFSDYYWEHAIEFAYGTEEIRKLISEFPNLKVITGLNTTKLYVKGDELGPTANKFADGSGYYDNYNTAIQIDSSEMIPIHHKSKLVLGAEKLPFIKSIPLMQKLSINLGGTSGRLGTQKSPSVFSSNNSDLVVAPIICYESIFGEYVNQYVLKGANLLSIITNDGWWGNTPGYKQHLAYARLRAIETRKWVVRSANTGISAIISDRGELLHTTNWWEKDSFSGSVCKNEKITFYTKHGDYLGRVAAFLAPLILLLALVKHLNKTGARLQK